MVRKLSGRFSILQLTRSTKKTQKKTETLIENDGFKLDSRLD